MRLVKPEIRNAIEPIADRYQIDPDLIEAMVIKESSGIPTATRYEPDFYKRYIVPLKVPEIEGKKRATSYGLLQVMFQSAIEDGYKGIAEDLLLIETGLEWGVKHLLKKIKKYGQVTLDDAISAYNAGNVRKDAHGKYLNQYYVDTVHKYLRYLSKIREG